MAIVFWKIFILFGDFVFGFIFWSTLYLIFSLFLKTREMVESYIGFINLFTCQTCSFISLILIGLLAVLFQNFLISWTISYLIVNPEFLSFLLFAFHFLYISSIQRQYLLYFFVCNWEFHSNGFYWVVVPSP